MNAFAERGESVGEPVVAVDAGYFFDEIDFAFEIETRTGQVGVPHLSLFGRTLWRGEGAAEAGERGFDEGRGDAFPVFCRAEEAMDLAQRECDGLAISGTGFPSGTRTLTSSPSNIGRRSRAGCG